ncbi:MAG: translation initiation factor IF-5A [Crenarchaeota archaeon]|nr:translation initiation factor IF-5A [Thermoproteota archaeon]
MSITYAELGELKEGSYVVIDGEPCRVVEISKAKTGKHGSAKVHLVAIGMFSGSRKTLVGPVDQRVEVPIIEKKVGQVTAMYDNLVQIMDLETYETFEVEKPSDPAIADKLAPGKEVEYWVVMGRKLIVRVRE